MFGYHISPVLYAPTGPVNLTSVSQLVDHDIKPHYKNDTFLIKCGSSVVSAFNWDGNLYSNQHQSQVNLAHPSEEKDWHTLMGHPSDRYLECLLTQLGINERFTSSKNCKICSKSKIQKKPHKSMLPQTSKPFYKINSNTLEISPTTRRGHRCILVLIDDYTSIFPFTSWRRIHSLKLKNYFLNAGTSIEKGAPNSPQTNGVAERLNRYLLFKIR
ncbi:hypothetical protein O181_004734 [Austropuccinia psidii MF-1]|uniref:Integrase catalytic domain-containing protein n=1 Tax=Austropuccinia psidii MF-1 TaxID=1389203 RepID=A0A9Q3BGT0_9BASI|nr:hypothetical protein [Austropuccinia psidii MF-1]